MPQKMKTAIVCMLHNLPLFSITTSSYKIPITDHKERKLNDM
jgi:hypothetical protein